MRNDPSTGDPSWIELFTSDTEGSRRFYGELFGWTATDPSEELGGYAMFLRDGVPVAGCMDNDEGSMGPTGWSVYLHSEDLAATLARASEHGGTVVAGPMQVGDAGHMGFLLDREGLGIGVWQPLSHPGFTTIAEDGAPSWFELLTPRYTSATEFYRDVFGWDLHTVGDSEELRYVTAGAGEAARAGIMDGSALEGHDMGWRVYVQVPDADVCAARAGELGGTVAAAPQDTPYGRMTAIVDPAGAPITVLGPDRA
ncbi:VOC family protein [Nocardioides sp. zg-DK7169]|uniref:VOC family protein n=1 Tax=Nocardioides sp. zg-DK7169 TaxID=2736600 RepID=UPI001554EAAC|nr:VOC family protein [Nocardioides sp. zg-DK7169]NPC97913.1 VOC family protein [Nocardioides sp. zg-DK7169]